jgi:hypothetical protein
MRHRRRRSTRATDPFEFAWKVPAMGYRLVRARLLGMGYVYGHPTDTLGCSSFLAGLTVPPLSVDAAAAVDRRGDGAGLLLAVRARLVG